MTTKSPVSSELSRELSLFHITMMGLGMMIGAGVFLGIGNAIHHAGPGGVLLTFALNGVIAIFTAMSYAELSSAIPKAGGAYNFARLGFGRGSSFVAGWMEWFASSVAGSVYAITFSIYTVRYLRVLGWFEWLLGPARAPGDPGIDLPVKVLALAVASLFIYINYRGAAETGKIGAIFTLGQTAFLVLIGVIGIVVAVRDPSRLENLRPFMPLGWSKLLVTMGFTYVAFEGFEVIAQAGDEAIDPRRNLPKAMIYSVFIVTLTYVAVAFATLVAVKPGMEIARAGGVVETVVVPWEWIGSFGEKGFGEAVGQLMPFANLLLTLAVIFASTSALNATIYSATRAAYALGRDKMLPGVFAAISKKRKTPWGALAFTAVIVIVVATFLPTMDVASSASIMFLFLFFLVNVCVIKIRRNMGDELTYGFLMPFFPVLPVLAIACQAVLAVWLIHMSVIAWIVAPVWVLSGIVIYFAYSKSRAVAIEHDILVFEEEAAPPGDEYRIMVAVANPKNAVEIARTTWRLGEAKNARVELLHMVEVPEQTPLSAAERYMVEGKEAIVEAMIYLAGLFPVSTTMRYCRNVARGIVAAVREKRADMLVMGWHGPGSARSFILGSTVDPVIERSPCNVVMLKDCVDLDAKRVLVPVAGGPNGAFALEVAAMLADRNEGEITVVTVARGKDHFDVDGFVMDNAGATGLPSERVHARVIPSPDVVGAILAESEGYDLVVLGATRQPLLYQVAMETVPVTVARRCTKPVAMVRASGGLRSWLRRWI